jgi:O-antigen/teichoic acid export membrane protein
LILSALKPESRGTFLSSPQSLSSQEVNKKIKSGVLILFSRTFFLNLLKALSVYLLARWLSPKDYGMFGILQGWVGITLYFCDIGTFGALIHQKEVPTEKQLRSSAFVQLGLSTFFAASFYLLAPYLVKFNFLEQDAVFMLRVLALSLPLGALKQAPRIVFERNLDFKAVATADLMEVLALYAFQWTLAKLGFGVWSFIVAVCVRNIVGPMTLIFFLKRVILPIPDIKEIKKLIPFGLPFQLNAILPALQGLIIPVVLGRLLGLNDIGIVTWVMGLSGMCFVLATNYGQVFFPSLSRLQEEKEKLKSTIGRSMEVALLGFGLIFTGLASCASTFIQTFFQQKWLPAIELLPLGALAYALYTATYLLGPILNSSGRPGVRLKIESFILVVKLPLSYGLTYYWGGVGFFIAFALSQLLGLILTTYYVRESLRGKTYRRFVAVTLSGVLSFYAIANIGRDYLILDILFTTLCYFSHLLIFDFSNFKDDVQWIWKEVKNNLLKKRFLHEKA